MSTVHGLAEQLRLGTTIWAVASLLGLGLLFQSAGWLYQVVKGLGAAYLIGIGAWMILTARRGAPTRRSRPGA